MTKHEWREKIKELRLLDGREAEGILADGSRLSDFFYSLHLQEIEKIREMIKSVKMEVGPGDNGELREKANLINENLLPGVKRILLSHLLAITDENI